MNRLLERVTIHGEGGFPRGAGALTLTEGAYSLGLDWDGRYSIPGPREVADLTGIASGYRVYQMLRHGDVPYCITGNLTDTRVYRLETTWVLRATISSRTPSGPQCAISFNNILAIGFTGGNAYQYTADITAVAHTFIASTKTAVNSKQATCFLQQDNGVATPRVTYGVQNQIYSTFDLTNTDATGTNPTYIGDTAVLQNTITSLAEEPGTGRILIGMRRALYTVHTEPGHEGSVEKLTEDFPDPVLDAGGQSDRQNFEEPATVGGVIYYPISGYGLLGWGVQGANGASYSVYMAPRDVNNGAIPRMVLPINALVAAGHGSFLVLFLGSKNTATLKDVTYYPGGNASIGGQFTTASEMWIGDPSSGSLVWHGVVLQCTNPLRGAWFNEDDNYLYMFSGGSESADQQMTRCLFPLVNPINQMVSSAVVLNAGTWQMEPGAITMGDDYAFKAPIGIAVQTLGLASATPSLEVEYKVTDDYDTSAFNSELVTFVSSEVALEGVRFPDDTLYRKLYLRFVGVGTGNSYALFRKADIWSADRSDANAFPRRR